MKNKWILQKTKTDCGIAALAMLFDVSYTAMKKLVMAQARKAGEPFDGTPKEYSRAVGHLLGDPVKVWYANGDTRPDIATKLKGRPAVLVCPALGYPAGTEYHAVFWTGNRILDPNGPGYGSYGQKGIKALKVFEEAWVLASDG